MRLWLALFAAAIARAFSNLAQLLEWIFIDARSGRSRAIEASPGAIEKPLGLAVIRDQTASLSHTRHWDSVHFLG